jgi:hypothetical protein|uniref:Leucine-rich repeat-containing N-terminal plant-type domain-containing protein n=1 Tax=Populus trichocarpa TaxID=3694 RepID=A0A2K2AAA4_POPTR
MDMTIIDISKNNMHGPIPQNICLIFSNMETLKMAKNGLTGCITSCLGNISSFRVLILSNNQLSTIKLEQLTELIFLQLSSNNLCGQIYSSVFSYSTLDCCLTVGETIMLSTVTVLL